MQHSCSAIADRNVIPTLETFNKSTADNDLNFSDEPFGQVMVA